jgi:uncharacterized protein YceK
MKCVALSAFLLTAAIGCGTTGNLLQERPAYFGGMAADFASFNEYREQEEQSLGYDLVWSSFLAVDVPLSAIGDTLTLPFVWLSSTFAPTTPAPFIDQP